MANCQEYDWLLTIAAAWTVTVAVACMLLLQRLIHHNTTVRLCCGKPVSIGAAAFCFMSTEGASSVVLCTPVQHAVYGLLARHCVRTQHCDSHVHPISMAQLLGALICACGSCTCHAGADALCRPRQLWRCQGMHAAAARWHGHGFGHSADSAALYLGILPAAAAACRQAAMASSCVCT